MPVLFLSKTLQEKNAHFTFGLEILNGKKCDKKQTWETSLIKVYEIFKSFVMWVGKIERL